MNPLAVRESTASERSSAAPPPPRWFGQAAPTGSALTLPPAVKPLPIPSNLLDTAPPDEELSLVETCLTRGAGRYTAGFLSSFLVHLSLVLIAGAYWLSRPAVEQSFTTTLLDGVVAKEPGVELLDTKLELAGGQGAEQPPVDPVVEVPIDLEGFAPAAAFDPTDFVPQGKGLGVDVGDGVGKGLGLPFPGPAKGKAVVAGSFTAWTVPTDPAPEQDYMIVIQVKLPRHVERYPITDLIGSRVVGTDRYRQEIPGGARGDLKIVENIVQLGVHVPGAKRLVRDTITVRSKLLKETQTLRIVF